jgi:hypothetical protein
MVATGSTINLILGSADVVTRAREFFGKVELDGSMEPTPDSTSLPGEIWGTGKVLEDSIVSRI